MTDRTRYGGFDLGAGPDGIVHLRSRLPEVVAIGDDVLVSFIKGELPGGPHATMNTTTRLLHIVTPECEFTYECLHPERDVHGWFFLFKRVYVSSAYSAWLETLQ